ncbi:MAG: hypothetical protein HYS12_26550 [Planctomycetes bacterium]|nr:hypothetical protein [Planctomycetota bacterium]
MQPRFTRAEYWVLELVVVGGWPLTYLAASSIEEIFTKPGHGLDHASLVDTLEGLFAEGLIEASVHPGDSPAGPLSRAEILVALTEIGPLRGRPATYYQLTPKGGAWWEAFTMPDWDAYVGADGDYDAGWGELTCTDAKWLEMKLHHFSAFESPVVWETVQYSDVRPWQVLYWKVLPHGHRVRFRYTPGAECTERDSPLLPSYACGEGNCALRDNWYRWC